MWKRYTPVYAVLILMCILVTSFGAFAGSVPRMTVDELKSRLGADDVVVLDVRSGRDWNAANTLITGAVRVSPNEVSQWAEDFPKAKSIVLYCTWPDEYTSARVARKLIQAGYGSVYALKGGWNEWQTRGYPTEPK